jgi:hypothetical protein
VHDEVGAAAALQQGAKSLTGAQISGQAYCNAAAAARIMRLGAFIGRNDGYLRKMLQKHTEGWA